MTKRKVVPAPKEANVAAIILGELGIRAELPKRVTPMFDSRERPSVHSLVSARYVKPEEGPGCCGIQ